MYKIYDYALDSYIVIDTIERQFAIEGQRNWANNNIEKWNKVTRATINKYSRLENRGFNGYCISKYVLAEFANERMDSSERKEIEQKYICTVEMIGDVGLFFTKQFPMLLKQFIEIQDEYKNLTNNNLTIGREAEVWGEIYKAFRNKDYNISYEMEFKNTRTSNPKGICGYDTATAYLKLEKKNENNIFHVYLSYHTDNYKNHICEFVKSFDEYKQAKNLLEIITGDNYKEYQNKIVA